jgi:hypothetical protein
MFEVLILKYMLCGAQDWPVTAACLQVPVAKRAA